MPRCARAVAGSGAGTGLLHGELCGRVGIEALIGNGLSAENRTAVSALVQSLQGTIERGQPVAQAGGDGVVHALGSQGLGRISDVTGLVFGCPVLLSCRLGIGEQARYLGALGAKPRPRLILIHRSPLRPSASGPSDSSSTTLRTRRGAGGGPGG